MLWLYNTDDVGKREPCGQRIHGELIRRNRFSSAYSEVIRTIPLEYRTLGHIRPYIAALAVISSPSTQHLLDMVQKAFSKVMKGTNSIDVK